ncbi:hypothetical protein JFR02_001193 [Vibrio harveyi]|nr:hypothetical protein [Vibrio harveyi]
MKLKNNFIFLLCLISFSSMAVKLDLDEQVYFFDVNKSKHSIVVINSGKELALGTLLIYEGIKDDKGKIQFDSGSESKKIDVVPKQFVLPPDVIKNIDLYPYNGSRDMFTESYYRLRVIPESASEAIKNNPKLSHLFSLKQLNNLDNRVASGKVSLNLGMGSIIVLQDFKKLDTSKLRVEHLRKDRLLVIRNIGALTFNMRDILLTDKNGRTEYLPDMIIKPGDYREINLGKLELKIEEDELNQIIFNSQNKNGQKVFF